MKLLFIILGSLSLALGVLGIFLPLLPTTPFLLLSASLYMHSSPRLYEWLLQHKYFGSYITNYRKYKVISVRVKITSLVMLWSTILFSVFAVCDGSLWLQLLLLGIAVGVTWHILSHKSTIK